MGKISPETIEQVAAANDIVEVIGGYFPVKRAGAVYKALCPFHNEKTPSFHINPARQSFHCFGCGKGGSVFRFVMDYENLDFVASVKRLAERAGIPIIEEELSAEEDARVRLRKRLLSLHREAAEWFHQNLLRTSVAAAARDYLKNRGLNIDIAKSWMLGYAPDSWDAFGNRAASLGYTAHEIAESGLVSLRDDGDFYDRFRNRLMFPIRNDIGEVIAFSGRVLEASDTAKYVNSPETMIFTKGNVLFGLHASKRDLIKTETAIVCEGQVDLISAFEAGIRNVVAPQGTAFTERQAGILKRFVREVVLCFDADAAGEKAAERSLVALLDQGLNVRVATMPPGDDPDSLIRRDGPDAFRAIIDASPGFFDFQIRHLAQDADLKTRQAFARKMAGFVILLQDPVQREDAISKIVSRLRILRTDFEKLFPRKQASAVSSSSGLEVSEAAAYEAPTHAVRMVCLYVLRDSATRKAVSEYPWKSIIHGLPGGPLLEKLILCETDPTGPAFLSTLNPAEEAFVSGLLHEKLPSDASARGMANWKGLALEQIKLQIQRINESIINATAVNGDISDLQKQRKEILDLKNLFTDVPRPSNRNEDPF